MCAVLVPQAWPDIVWLLASSLVPFEISFSETDKTYAEKLKLICLKLTRF
jgi:hypothetical protein